MTFWGQQINLSLFPQNMYHWQNDLPIMFVLFVFLNQVNTIAALMCYKCDSQTDGGCNDPFEGDLHPGMLEECTGVYKDACAVSLHACVQKTLLESCFCTTQ